MIWFVLRIISIVVLSYLIGNINFARILAAAKKVDITKEGSGNPGSMNMLRTLGLSIGMLTLLLEALKGVSAALFGYFVLGIDNLSMLGMLIGGISVVIGQIRPIIYKFRGGKGMACVVGVFFIVDWKIALIAFAVGLLLIFIFDYGALSSLVFLTIVTVYNLVRFWGDIPIMCILLLIYTIIIILHNKNIKRMLTLTENRANFRLHIKKMFWLGKNKNAEVKTEVPAKEKTVVNENSAVRDGNVEKIKGDP